MNALTIRYMLIPIVGAIIGYATNWIAVKMLFRPHHEIRLFGFRLPFTPGVIPKGQGRMARAVGQAVQTQLLTRDVLTRVLLSEEMKEKVRTVCSDWLAAQESSDVTLEDTALLLISEEQASACLISLKDQLTDLVFAKLIAANPGAVIAEKTMEAAKEKLAESMLGMFVGDSMLERIADVVEAKVNEHLADHGEEYIRDFLEDETSNLLGKTRGEVLTIIRKYEIDFPALMVSYYEQLVPDKLPAALDALNLSKIVEDRINAMEVEEVEELLLAIMKKELSAIVNLGALIGLILGCANVLLLLL